MQELPTERPCSCFGARVGDNIPLVPAHRARRAGDNEVSSPHVPRAFVGLTKPLWGHPLNTAQRGRGFKAVTPRPTGTEAERGLQPAPSSSKPRLGQHLASVLPVRVTDPKRWPQKGPDTPLLPPKGQSRLEASPQPAPTHDAGSLQPCRAAGGAFLTSNPVFEVWRYLQWKKDTRNESTATERPRGCGVGPGVELGAGSGPSRTNLVLAQPSWSCGRLGTASRALISGVTPGSPQ